MLRTELLGCGIEELREKIMDYTFMCKARTEPKHFSREGKLGFVNLLLFMLNFVKKSVQLELDLFMKMLDEQKQVSKQAFSKARQKISHKAFEELFYDTVKIAGRSEDMNTLRGMRVLAVDGTSLAVENTPELIAYYGCSGRGATSATARVSALYDVLNEYLVDANIEKFSVGERELALQHIEHLDTTTIKKCLLIFDRGYASAELISTLFESNKHFLIRVRNKFNAEIDGIGLGDGVVAIKFEGKQYNVRVLKFPLETGEIETLITDLPSEILDISDGKEIYFKRWPIETRYDVVKEKLQLENFTGKTVLAVKQDFYASMFLSNIASFSKYISDAKISNDNESKELKYKYKTNTNLLIGKLKDNLVKIMLDNDPIRRGHAITALCHEFSKNRIPIRTRRQFLRGLPRKKRFHMNKKVVL